MAVLLTGWLWVRTNLVQKYLATGALSWELGSQLETVSQDVKAEAPDQVATFRCRCFDNGFECVSPQKSLGSTVLKRKPALASCRRAPPLLALLSQGQLFATGWEAARRAWRADVSSSASGFLGNCSGFPLCPQRGKCPWSPPQPGMLGSSSTSCHGGTTLGPGFLPAMSNSSPGP